MSETTQHVTFTKEKLERLKVEHQKAVDSKRKQFKFEGNVYLTAYAKYMIEYLESRFTNG